MPLLKRNLVVLMILPLLAAGPAFAATTQPAKTIAKHIVQPLPQPSKIHPNATCTPGNYHYVTSGANYLTSEGYKYEVWAYLYSDWCGDAYAEAYVTVPAHAPGITYYTAVWDRVGDEYGQTSASCNAGGPDGQTCGPIDGSKHYITGRSGDAETTIFSDWGLAISSGVANF